MQQLIKESQKKPVSKSSYRKASASSRTRTKSQQAQQPEQPHSSSSTIVHQKYYEQALPRQNTV